MSNSIMRLTNLQHCVSLHISEDTPYKWFISVADERYFVALHHASNLNIDKFDSLAAVKQAIINQIKSILDSYVKLNRLFPDYAEIIYKQKERETLDFVYI